MFPLIKPFIVEETKEGYILQLWEPMLRGVSSFKKDNSIKTFESFISKMMEFERACMEVDDGRPKVIMAKNLKEVKVIVPKKEGNIWIYYLNPYGYQGNWEIFKVERV